MLGIEVLDIDVTHLRLPDKPMSDDKYVQASEWQDVVQRVQEEIRELQRLLIIEFSEDTERQLMIIQGIAQSARGEQLQIDLVCDTYYPSHPPQLDVQIDGIPQRFPALYQQWHSKLRLSNLVQAIIDMHE